MPDDVQTPEASPETAIEVLDLPAQGPTAPLAPVQADYRQAIEFGKVAAASGLYPNARTAARAAMVAAMGMALGVDPPVALNSIHILEKSEKVTFLIEGKLLAALINRTPGIGFVPLVREDERVELEFTRGGESAGPTVVWDKERAVRAGLWSKDTYKKYPREMLTWRALAEGTRIYCPEVLAGQSIYVKDAEFADDQGLSLSQTLEGPPRVQPLTDEAAEALRETAEEVYGELAAVNPERLVPGRYRGMVRDASHSHAELRMVVKTLEDLRDTERVIADLKQQLSGKLDDKAAAEVFARAERRGSQREKIDVLRAALAEQGAETEEVPDDDASE